MSRLVSRASLAGRRKKGTKTNQVAARVAADLGKLGAFAAPHISEARLVGFREWISRHARPRPNHTWDHVSRPRQHKTPHSLFERSLFLGGPELCGKIRRRRLGASPRALSNFQIFTIQSPKSSNVSLPTVRSSSRARSLIFSCFFLLSSADAARTGRRAARRARAA